MVWNSMGIPFSGDKQQLIIFVTAEDILGNF